MNASELVNLINTLIDRKIEKPYKLGRIDPNYNGGLPRVLFDGESKISAKRYSHASNYTPQANERVLLANVSGTYVILSGVKNS